MLNFYLLICQIHAYQPEDIIHQNAIMKGLLLYVVLFGLHARVFNCLVCSLEFRYDYDLLLVCRML